MPKLCDLLIEHSEREATNQTAFFRDCLLAGRQKENTNPTAALGLSRVTVDTPIYFSLDDLIAKVRAKNVEPNEVMAPEAQMDGWFLGNEDRPEAVEYPRPESLHPQAGLATAQGRGTRGAG